MTPAWTITHNHLDNQPVVVTSLAAARNPNTIPFRLLDDDREVYYTGTLADDPHATSQLDAIAYGMRDAGCTLIEVERDGRWVQEVQA